MDKAKEVYERLPVHYLQFLKDNDLPFEEFTCATCGRVSKCNVAFDLYCQGDDCLGEK